MSILNLNPARLDIELPVGDTFELQVTFQENVSGGVSAFLYDRQGVVKQEFSVTEVSSSEDETVVIVSLPNTTDKLNGKWELTSVSDKFKTKLQGDFKIADPDGISRPSNNESIIISESNQSVVVEFQGTPGPSGITPEIGENGNWFIGDTDTGERAVPEDVTAPEAQVIQSGPVTENTQTDSSEITPTSFKLLFLQAISGPQLFQWRKSSSSDWQTLTELPINKDNSEYEYEAYVGDLASVSDVDLVEQQTLAASGTAVSELTIPGNQGDVINVGLIVKDGEGNKVLYDTITVTLLDPQVTELSVTPNPVEVDKDASVQLVPNVTASDGADESVTYSISNEAVATVSSTGLVTGIDAGSAIITVRSVFNPSVFVEISVVTSSDAPAMPEWTVAGFSNTLTTITVDWFPVTGADSYIVRLNGGADIPVPSATSHLFQNLTLGNQYTVEVRSSGAGGLSLWNSIQVQTDSFTEVEESQTNQFTTE